MEDTSLSHSELLLDQLPNELISSILMNLPAKDLARLSVVNSVWLDSARLIYKSRIADAFSESDGIFRYVFEASQPAESVQGSVLRLQEKRGSVLQSTKSGDDFTTFEFPHPGVDSSQYSFTLESDTFIQLCILGNIIQPRAGGGLEGVALHLEDFCRIKNENLGTSIGSKQRFKINDNAYLVAKLLKRERFADDKNKVDEASPIRFDIEYHSLEIKSVHLLRTLENYLANALTSTSTALVLRSSAG